MIDRSTAWKIFSQRPGPTVVLAKMYYGSDGYLPIGSGLVTLEDEDFIPLITTIPSRFQEVDFWTREFSISDLTLEILNLPFHGSTRFSDLLDERGSGNDIGFENRDAAVVLWKPGITTFADCFQLFPVGVTRKPYVQDGIVYVDVQDHTFLTLQNVQLDRLQDSDAVDTDQGLPEESRGKVKPRIYGDHTYLQGDDAKSLDTASTVNNMTPCLYLGMESDGKHHWMVAGHEMNELTVASLQEQLWGWDDRINRFVRLDGATVEQNTSAGCIISTANKPGFIDYWYAKGTVVASASQVDAAKITPFANIARAGDKLFAAASTGHLLDNAQNTDWIKLQIPFPAYDNDIGTVAAGTVYVYLALTYTQNGGANLANDFDLFAGIADPPTATLLPAAMPEAGGTYPEARLKIDEIATASEDIYIRLEKDVNNDPACQLDVYEGYKEISYQPDRNLPLYSAGKGTEIDANWTNRAVVDGYDEQHADHGGSGNLGENPATLLELTLRNDAGLGDSRLSLNSLNTASNDVSSLKAAPTFLKQPDSYLEALFKLVQQFRGFLWWTPTGELFLKILEDDYTTPDITIDGDLITSLTTGRTDENRLYTAVQMLYNGRDDRDVVETTLVEDATAQTWYSVTQAETLLKFPAPAFRESASAVSVGNYFLENHLNIHNTVKCAVPIMYNHLDIGTLVGFENLSEDIRGHDMSASYTIAGQTVQPYFLINAVDRSDELKFEAFQVHKLD